MELLRPLILSTVCCFFFTEATGRTWTDAQSGRKIEAEYVSSDGKNVTIVLDGGKEYSLPLTRFSQDDQAFVEGQLNTSDDNSAKLSEDRFEDMPKLKSEEIPVSGNAHPSLESVDSVIKEFMADKGIGAVSFAVSKNNEILHERSFGWADADLKNPLQLGVRMRVASMTKPVVQAAVKSLVSEEKLSMEDHVFSILELEKYEEAKQIDERWKQITIQHLVDHKGGWDRVQSGDFTFDDGIHEEFRIDLDEMMPEHVVRFGMTKDLDFNPGEKYAYCNYGYILLVRVVEKVSGGNFVDFLQTTIGKEAEAPSLSLSRADAKDRQPGEVWYCYHPEYERKQVPLPFRTEARDGAGALACTAADYCRFLSRYTITGSLRQPGGRYRGAFSGSHPGVTAICSQRPDGINYVVICNRRGSNRSDWNNELRSLIDPEIEKTVENL